MNKLREFINIYRLYSRRHSLRYAVRRAYEIAFLNLPF